MPVFPGMRFVVNLTLIGLELNRFPSEVYSQFLKSPRDIELILGALEHRRKLEDKERTKIEEEQEAIRNKHGHR